MAGCDSVEVGAGDLFVLETPGGGGYGPPPEAGLPAAPAPRPRRPPAADPRAPP